MKLGSILDILDKSEEVCVICENMNEAVCGNAEDINRITSEEFRDQKVKSIRTVGEEHDCEVWICLEEPEDE